MTILKNKRDCRTRITLEELEGMKKRHTKASTTKDMSVKSMPRWLNVRDVYQQWVSEDVIKMVAFVHIHQDGHSYLLDPDTVNITSMTLLTGSGGELIPFKVEKRIEGEICFLEAFFNMSEINEIMLEGNTAEMGRISIDLVGDVYNSEDPNERKTLTEEYWSWVFGHDLVPYTLGAFQQGFKDDKIIALIKAIGGVSYDLEDLTLTDIFSGEKLTARKITDPEREGIDTTGLYIYSDVYELFEISLPENYNFPDAKSFVKEINATCEFTLRHKITGEVSAVTDVDYNYYFYISDMMFVDYDEEYKDYVWEPLSMFNNIPYEAHNKIVYNRGILYMLDLENHLHRYDIIRKTALSSTHIPLMPSGSDVEIDTMFVHDDKIHLLAAHDQVHDVYDIKENTWTSKDGSYMRNSGFPAFYSIQGVVYENKVYIWYTGEDANLDWKKFGYMFIYDLENDSWTHFKTPYMANGYSASLIDDNIVYIIEDGYYLGDGSKEDFARIFAYNITNNAWSRGPKVPGYDYKFELTATGTIGEKLAITHAYSYSTYIAESPVTYNLRTKEFLRLPLQPFDCGYQSARSIIFNNEEIYTIGDGNILYRLTHKDNLLNMEMDSDDNPRYTDEVIHDIDVPNIPDLSFFPNFDEEKEEGSGTIYDKTSWINGNVITADKLNKIEKQISEIAKAKNDSYAVTIWNDGDVITSELLNKIEYQLELLSK